MAKNDKNDETPIVFHISSSISGKGSRIPIPINQPNWKYKNFSSGRPSWLEWVVVISLFLLSSTLGIILITNGGDDLLLWFVCFFMTIVSGLQIKNMVERNKRLQKTQTSENSPQKKRQKKVFKQRKDYR